MTSGNEHVTRILAAAAAGTPGAADELLPVVYEELRRLAHRRMAHERPGQTLQPTALVHEAYLKLVGNPDMEWKNRGHFFGAAARAMRQILVDRARRKAAVKRGGDRARVDLDPVELAVLEQVPDAILSLEVGLERLQAIDPRKHDIVMLRYFSGLTIEQTAAALGLSKTTVKDEWQFARAWLVAEIERAE